MSNVVFHGASNRVSYFDFVNNVVNTAAEAGPEAVNTQNGSLSAARLAFERIIEAHRAQQVNHAMTEILKNSTPPVA